MDQIRDNTAALVTKTGEVTQNVVAKVTDEQFLAQQKERASIFSKNVVDTSADWFSQLTQEKDPNENFDPFADLNHLKSTSTGKMDGMEGAPVHAEPESAHVVLPFVKYGDTDLLDGFSATSSHYFL